MSAVFFHVLAACADPGCIRNSECPVGLECTNAKCVAPGAADGANQPSACDASVCASSDAGASKSTDAGMVTDAAAALITSNNALSSEQAMDAAVAGPSGAAEASESFAP